MVMQPDFVAMNKKIKNLVTPLNFTHGSYARDAQKGNSRGSGRSGSSPARGRGKFAKFQCQICLKFDHTANVCHFKSDESYHPRESLFFIDPATQQSIPYSTGTYKTSNTDGGMTRTVKGISE